jgi:hypothetical protein
MCDKGHSTCLLLAAALVVLSLSFAGNAADAQSTSEYAHQVDSLAHIWQAATTTVAAKAAAANAMPASTIHVGPINVRADSQWTALARTVTEKLAPAVSHAYGKFSWRLGKYQFVLRNKGGVDEVPSVLSGIVDSTGRERLRGSDYSTSHDLYSSWQRKAELVIADEMGPSVQSWIRADIPIDAPTQATWSEARVSLILSQTPASADCVHGRIDRCVQILGLVEVADPAFALFNAASRVNVIERWSPLLRRANTKQYDRCTVAKVEAACDSLVRTMPPDVVPLPVPPVVRQSFVRYALMIGGAGAFDRFMAQSSPRQRIEAATKLPADTVVARWRDTILDSRSSSTAIDMETGISALAWAALCGALALRSSRWR